MEDYREKLKEEIGGIEMNKEEMIKQLESLRISQFEYYAGMNEKDRTTDDIIKYDVKALDLAIALLKGGREMKKVLLVEQKPYSEDDILLEVVAPTEEEGKVRIAKLALGDSLTAYNKNTRLKLKEETFAYYLDEEVVSEVLEALLQGDEEEAIKLTLEDFDRTWEWVFEDVKIPDPELYFKEALEEFYRQQGLVVCTSSNCPFSGCPHRKFHVRNETCRAACSKLGKIPCE